MNTPQFTRHDPESLTFISHPNYVGAYWFGDPQQGLAIHFKKKPSWLHRFLMRAALGITWRDK